MPLLFAVGQHRALDAIQEDLREGEVLLAHHDDIDTVSPDPERVSPMYATLQDHLYSYVRIRIHGGKTQVWNRGGTRPSGCDVPEHIAQTINPNARVWRGPDLPEDQQGIKVLGSPLGHPAFIEGFLQKKVIEHQTLFDSIPLLPDLQSEWSLLLHCASAKANYLLRVVEPDAVAEFARAHDQGIWKCLCKLLHVDPVQREETSLSGSLPLSLGGLGLRSTARSSVSLSGPVGRTHSR